MFGSVSTAAVHARILLVVAPASSSVTSSPPRFQALGLGTQQISLRQRLSSQIAIGVGKISITHAFDLTATFINFAPFLMR